MAEYSNRRVKINFNHIQRAQMASEDLKAVKGVRSSTVTELPSQNLNIVDIEVGYHPDGGAIESVIKLYKGNILTNVENTRTRFNRDNWRF